MARRIAQYQICTLLTVIDLASYTFMKLLQLPALSHNFLTKQIGGGVLTLKRTKKDKKKTKNQANSPILMYRLYFFDFLVFFGSFLVFFWDDILTLKSHATKTKETTLPKPKKPKNPKKKQFPILEFRILAKNNAKRPKKTKKSDSQFGNSRKPIKQ